MSDLGAIQLAEEAGTGGKICVPQLKHFGPFFLVLFLGPRAARGLEAAVVE